MWVLWKTECDMKLLLYYKHISVYRCSLSLYTKANPPSKVSIWAADYLLVSHFPTKIWLSLSSSSTETCFCSSSRSPFPPLPLTRCLSGARLHDLSWRLGQRCSPADVRKADGQIQPGGLLCALGLHLGNYGHPGRSHPLLSGFCSGQPTRWLHVRGAAGRE